MLPTQLIAAQPTSHMSDSDRNHLQPALPGLISVLLAAIMALGLFDLFTDPVEELHGMHAVIDVALVLVSGAGALLLGRGWLRAERSVRGLQASLATNRAERDAWRERAQGALRGLGEALDRQFDSWSLTATEKEVAMLLLKGFSHKEAAALSGRSERTVRQHAVSVYRKSGLAGRAELAAFFFEDMLLPGEPMSPAAPPPASTGGAPPM
jgi:DNA-binding CsgD family transcriptional regulator